MKYRIVFSNGRRTLLRGDWDYCQYYLERILKYKPDDRGDWIGSSGLRASIVATNGVPF